MKVGACQRGGLAKSLRPNKLEQVVDLVVLRWQMRPHSNGSGGELEVDVWQTRQTSGAQVDIRMNQGVPSGDTWQRGEKIS